MNKPNNNVVVGLNIYCIYCVWFIVHLFLNGCMLFLFYFYILCFKFVVVVLSTYYINLYLKSILQWSKYNSFIYGTSRALIS